MPTNQLITRKIIPPLNSATYFRNLGIFPSCAMCRHDFTVSDLLIPFLSGAPSTCSASTHYTARRSFTVPSALDHVLHVLGSRPGNKVRRITTTSVIAKVLDLEAFRYWFDPERVCDAMHDLPPVA
jgi:hypothetical protein